MDAVDESSEFRTDDDRVVAYRRYGPAGGRPVVFHSGTPGTRHLGPRIVAQVERHELDLLIMDRPGYGGSTRLPGRRIADVVPDVARLVDLHGWDRFAVWGGSGGAAHALACAALLPDRVERCAAMVSPAPYDAAGLDWFQDMSPGNVEEFTLALQGEQAYRPLVERLARESVEAARQGEIPLPPDYELPESDKAALRARMSDPGYLDRLIAANLHGIDGWIDDCIAAVQAWGFEPAGINVPVSVWYGPKDVLVPPSHAEWLVTHIPGAEEHQLPGGHMLDEPELDAICNWLSAGT
jgi:pimeloyl-ACP methyl ester carboxylesterase